MAATLAPAVEVTEHKVKITVPCPTCGQRFESVERERDGAVISDMEQEVIIKVMDHYRAQHLVPFFNKEARVLYGMKSVKVPVTH
jgi:hypothetical protein